VGQYFVGGDTFFYTQDIMQLPHVVHDLLDRTFSSDSGDLQVDPVGFITMAELAGPFPFSGFGPTITGGELL
jgi:hypothetical protein